jgi:hypothetical protein
MSDPTPASPGPQPADAYQIGEVALTDISVFKRLRPLEPAFSKRSPHPWGQKDCGIRSWCVVPLKATT